MDPDATLALWVERDLPMVRALLEAEEREWGTYPPGTDVCLSVLGPAFVDAVRRNASSEAAALAAFFEEMLDHDDWAIRSDAGLTLGPWLADAARDEPRVITALGGRMRQVVQQTSA